MNFNLNPNSDKPILTLNGEFTIYAVAEFKEKCKELKLLECNTLSIDLSGIVRIDTSGMQCLIALKEKFNQDGHILELNNHSEAVLTMIELYGLLSFFGDPMKIRKVDQSKFQFKYGRKKGLY